MVLATTLGWVLATCANMGVSVHQASGKVCVLRAGTETVSVGAGSLSLSETPDVARAPGAPMGQHTSQGAGRIVGVCTSFRWNHGIVMLLDPRGSTRLTWIFQYLPARRAMIGDPSVTRPGPRQGRAVVP